MLSEKRKRCHDLKKSLWSKGLIIPVIIGPGRRIVTENIQVVDFEMVTKYSPIFFANFDEYFLNLCNNSDMYIKYDFSTH